MNQSEWNNVYFNHFLQNKGEKSQGYTDSNTNSWSNGTHGNYWSDYIGSDLNNDGIGDIVYNLDGNSNSYDLYPLMKYKEKDDSLNAIYSILEFFSLSNLMVFVAIISSGLVIIGGMFVIAEFKNYKSNENTGITKNFKNHLLNKFKRQNNRNNKTQNVSDETLSQLLDIINETKD